MHQTKFLLYHECKHSAETRTLIVITLAVINQSTGISLKTEHRTSDRIVLVFILSGEEREMVFPVPDTGTCLHLNQFKRNCNGCSGI